jgi:ATP phosphoribosyltransferase regulatory subunit
MPGPERDRWWRLKAQNDAMLALFAEAGFEEIRPPILQPADVFIEKSGEAIRARTFIFSDPDGERELCLRPDLTVPTCRWHLAHAPDPAAPARYCYAGPVFRYDNGARALHPEEYEQVGLEWFGASGAEVDAEVLALAVRAVRAGGLEDFTITTGDVALIRALLQDIAMPERWRARLLRRFRNPAAFWNTLRELSAQGPRRRSSISELVDRLAGEESPDMNKALALVEEELGARGLELVGGRAMEEIATRLLDKAIARPHPPLPEEAVALVRAFLDIHGPLKVAIIRLGRLAERAGDNLRAAWENFAARVEHIARALPGQAQAITFAADFGRAFDYYTGFVFQIEAEINGERLPVAGGGRYDDMLASLGGPRVPAAGLAIHAERLLAAAEGRARA